jgi:hypothetical protein
MSFCCGSLPRLPEQVESMPRAVVISFAMVLSAAVICAAPIDDLPAPIATRQAVFSIPFTVPFADPTGQPTEVRLLASVDRGATWQVVDRVDLRMQQFPYKGSFSFRAPSDGEYWFAIRTVDRAGQMRMDRGAMPELRVVVDTRPPRLEFSAIRGAAGEIVVRWDTVDPNLKPDSLKLQYQSTANVRWQPIAIDLPGRDAGRSAMSSSATWWPADAAGLLTIKAEVSDAAGNTTVAQAQVNLAQSAGAGMTVHSVEPKRAPSTANTDRSEMNVNGAASSLATRETAGGHTADGNTSHHDRSQFDTRGSTDRDAGFSRAVQWPPDVRTELPLGRGTSQRPAPDDGPIRTRGQMKADDIGPIEGPALVPPVEGPTHPPIGSQFTAQPGTPRQPMPRSFDYVVPPGEQLRMVNSTVFELDYDVESVGRSGISKVELWVTRDGGRTWSNVGADADNRSPFRATVDGEGVYGFRLTVQSGSGLGGQPPQPGDVPEVWIGVDLTRPMARLISAESSTGERAGEMMIRYEASDALLASRPITLLQSTQPGGPWTTIAAGLTNTGQYSWRFDESTPQRVYLRLEARDEAGNIAIFDSSEPVILERMLPQGRLRDVRPVGGSARLNEPLAR